jgi:chromate transporter
VSEPAPSERRPGYSIGDLLRYFLGLGTLGFGGPVALVGYMHRDLVEARKGITEEEYREGLALAQLAPGPLAAQLGIYLGYVHYGIPGATLAGIAFVLPSLVMVLVISWAYVTYHGLSWMQAVFAGVGPAVIGIIAISAYKLTTRTLRRDYLLWAIYAAALLGTVVTESENVLLFLGAGVLAWIVKSPPRRTPTPACLVPAALWLGALVEKPDLLWRMALFFGKAGAFVFGSGLAIVPFLYAGCVHEMRWLNERQFMDAVAVAMITPGPVVITTAFIGYLVAGLPGAGVAALATFFPCYLFTILPAPHFRRWGKAPAVLAFIGGVTAAATGAITGAVIVLGRHSLAPQGAVSWPAVAIAVVTLAALARFKKLSEPVVVMVASMVGLLLRMVLRIG